VPATGALHQEESLVLTDDLTGSNLGLASRATRSSAVLDVVPDLRDHGPRRSRENFPVLARILLGLDGIPDLRWGGLAEGDQGQAVRPEPPLQADRWV
jgi:hypothetical protein